LRSVARLENAGMRLLRLVGSENAERGKGAHCCGEASVSGKECNSGLVRKCGNPTPDPLPWRMTYSFLPCVQYMSYKISALQVHFRQERTAATAL